MIMIQGVLNKCDDIFYWSQSEKNSIIYSKLSRCDYYDASHADCAKYINEELKRMCGGSYNCIATENYNYAGHSTYYNNTDK